MSNQKRFISAAKILDENKLSGSTRNGVRSIEYFLRRYREVVIWKRTVATDRPLGESTGDARRPESTVAFALCQHR